jgi:uncharacterized membrane protein YfcA
MELKYAIFIVVGLIFGAVFGIFFGKAIENPLLSVAFGAFGGTFLGWFGVIIAQQKNDKEPEK